MTEKYVCNKIVKLNDDNCLNNHKFTYYSSFKNKMDRRQQLSDYERGQIKAYHESGLSHREIGKKNGKKLETVKMS